MRLIGITDISHYVLLRYFNQESCENVKISKMSLALMMLHLSMKSVVHFVCIVVSYKPSSHTTVLYLHNARENFAGKPH